VNGTQAGFDVAQTFPIGQLREIETIKLVQTGEAALAKITAVSGRAFLKLGTEAAVSLVTGLSNDLTPRLPLMVISPWCLGCNPRGICFALYSGQMNSRGAEPSAWTAQFS
jgi:hypothetical protein